VSTIAYVNPFGLRSGAISAQEGIIPSDEKRFLQHNAGRTLPASSTKRRFLLGAPLKKRRKNLVPGPEHGFRESVARLNKQAKPQSVRLNFASCQENTGPPRF
jgi:hypothetical protein